VERGIGSDASCQTSPLPFTRRRGGNECMLPCSSYMLPPARLRFEASVCLGEEDAHREHPSKVLRLWRKDIEVLYA
jgi:hypothetical protein